MPRKIVVGLHVERNGGSDDVTCVHVEINRSSGDQLRKYTGLL